MRYSYVEIDLDSIKYNIKEIKKHIGKNVKILAIVKANAYGHGIVPVSIKIEKYVFGFGVALSEEALLLRARGIKKPILTLGHTDEKECIVLLENNITQTVFCKEQAFRINEIAKKNNIIAKIHLKIETGMNRLGFADNKESIDIIRKIEKLDFIEIEGIFSHIANGGCKDLTYSKYQIDRFKIFSKKIESMLGRVLIKHLANSSTLIELPESHFQMVRPGILLYGSYSTEHKNIKKIEIKKSLTLKSKIIQIKTINKGEQVSYGGTFIAKKETKIAILPIGYADGIFRNLSNKGYFLFKDKKVKIIGNICMDQLIIDVTNIGNINIHDEITIYGINNHVEKFARILKTIPYEVYCAIRERVPRIYKNYLK